MKVNQAINNPIHAKETSEALKSQRLNQKEHAEKMQAKGTLEQSAKTDISAKAREFARAKEIAKDSPDIREQKIAELKKRIANREYNVRPEDVAEKMVAEHLRTRDL